MVKKQFKPLAFIDSGKIKITDEEGVEYIPFLENKKKEIKKNTTYANISLSFLILFISLLCAHGIFDILSNIHIGMTIGAIIASFISLSMFQEEKNSSRASYLDNTAEFNLAKQILQPKILELEQELATHNNKIKEIENGHKFNFKKDELYME